MVIEAPIAVASVFMVFFVTIVIGALAVLFFGKETKGTNPDKDPDQKHSYM
ncbi:hypothetical protein [Paenibacillus sp. Soil522]|uniref:hypothetical protein n=1 Tax=Paenibacillus sp. Soil522 TaxID=1736388 RepID=UPI00138F64E5|nr:hypothetical protein [Paenibacillus sp. Soil522]